MASPFTNNPDNPFRNLKVTRKDLRNSLDWWQHQIQLLPRSSYQQRVLMGSARHQVINFTPGKLYLFAYNAKTKDTLPYWDKFPCIFPIHKMDDGFLGINLHYLPPQWRLRLMEGLWELANNDKLNATTRILMSYELLKKVAESQGLGIENSIKRYLNSHMETRFLEIPASSWTMVALLPIENFQKASKEKVWNDTRRKAGGR